MTPITAGAMLPSGTPCARALTSVLSTLMAVGYLAPNVDRIRGLFARPAEG